MTQRNQRNGTNKDEQVRRYLKGGARQEKRKRNLARGKDSRGGLREDLEDGFEDDEPAAHRSRSGRAEHRSRDTVRATVLSLARGSVRIRMDEVELDAPLSGALRGTALAVGDELEVEPRVGGPPLLRALRARRTLLTRPDPGNRHRRLLVAANVDLGVVVCAAKAPPFRPGLIDRYLLALEHGGVEALLCVNKVDLPAAQERNALAGALEPYRELGLRILLVSAARGDGVDDLRAALADRTAVLVGHSGVGKSSLLNALAGAELADEGDVRAFDGKGRHTTTSSTLVELEGGGRLIDTPGIRAFGVAGVGLEELRTGFPGFAPFLGGCRFGDCAHAEEPDCGVRGAVEAGRLSEARYRVYLRLREDLGTQE